MERNATTATAILGLLSLRPTWPTYEITKQLRRNVGLFWPRAESRIYDEAKRLVERGLATAQTEMSAGRSRTVYAITAVGRQFVANWLATPPRPTILECEPLLRVFLADFSTREQLQAALDQVRADAETIQTIGREVGQEYLRGTAPFQDQVHVRALVFDFLWNYAAMLRQWADRAEAAIDDWDTFLPQERNDASVRMIEANLHSNDQ
jgi:PadR family transcriptional regulator AphA